MFMNVTQHRAPWLLEASLDRKRQSPFVSGVWPRAPIRTPSPQSLAPVADFGNCPSSSWVTKDAGSVVP